MPDAAAEPRRPVGGRTAEYTKQIRMNRGPAKWRKILLARLGREPDADIVEGMGMAIPTVRNKRGAD